MDNDLKQFVRDVVDFPKPKITFKDISPLLNNPAALSRVVSAIRANWEKRVDTIVALDARGFIFGSILAYVMQLPLVMIRKKGKLPGETYDLSYNLEYGESELSVLKDAFSPNARALIIDDLLATGGTAKAACLLTEKAGAKIAGCAFVIELEELGGREILQDQEIQSLITYKKGA